MRVLEIVQTLDPLHPHQFSRRKVKIKERLRRLFAAILFLLFYALSLFSLFPKVLLIGNAIINIYAHLFGVAIGATTPYLLIARRKESQ